MDEPHPDDYGDFQIQTSRNDDLKMFRDGMAKARLNQQRPGHSWHRIRVKMDSDTGPVELIKYYHVDLTSGIAEVYETQNGEETARRSLDIRTLG